MDILWFVVKMVIYGFIIGMIIGLGAFLHAFIAIHFEKGESPYDEGVHASLQHKGKTASGNG